MNPRDFVTHESQQCIIVKDDYTVSEIVISVPAFVDECLLSGSFSPSECVSRNVNIVFKWRTNFITTLQLIQFMALHLSSSSLSVTCEKIAQC